MASLGIRVEAVSPELADRAFTAFRRFGKSRHPARLNICDCFAYALARETGAPWLFKGSDFSRTDIVPAVSRL